MQVTAAEGAVLAHAVKAPGVVFKKGRVLTAADLRLLREGGVREIVGARLAAGEVPEDAAAARLGAALTGPHLRAAEAATGRANLIAGTAGVLRLDVAAIDALNAIDEAITLATLSPFAVVAEGQMVATAKIIPFAVAAQALERAVALAVRTPLLTLAPFRPLRFRMVQTRLAALADKALDKTVRITAGRVGALGGVLSGESRCEHDPAALTDLLASLPDDWDVLLVVGASAITDHRDVLPAALAAAGGRIEHLGMPVDPGNLLLLAELRGRPALGLPGCARSPALNGFDWVLQRLAAGIPVGRHEIQRMGVGGLLAELPSRPQPRQEPATTAGSEIAAVVLAAGRSRRMGGPNKLLLEVDGAPMVRHTVDAALAAGCTEVIVVTGHQDALIAAALAGRPVRLVRNPDYADGLSTSLRAGLDAVRPTALGAIICLGDMPRIGPGHLRRLIAAFDPDAGRAIAVPTHRGKRGNPVLWSRAFFAAMRLQQGDTGARALIGPHESQLVEVEMDDDAPLVDVDTPDALAALTRVPA